MSAEDLLSQSVEHVHWWCDTCDTHGVIEHDGTSALLDVIEAIRESHRDASNGRHSDLADMRVNGHLGV